MKIQDSTRGDLAVSAANPNEVSDLAALFDGHIEREFADHDVNATMETMVPEPYVHCVPIMTGGFGARHPHGRVEELSRWLGFSGRQILRRFTMAGNLRFAALIP